MKTPKTIQTRQIVLTLPGDVRPGAILADGLVLSVRRGTSGVGYYFETPHATIHAADPSEAVQVYAQISEEDAEIAREAYAAAEERAKGRRP